MEEKTSPGDHNMEKSTGIDNNGEGGEDNRHETLFEDEEEEDDEVVLPGFRFHPTDEELVGFYLRRKVGKKPLSIEIIKQIDIYKYDPWDLPKVSTVGDKEWYFFCLRGRKYRNSIRPNRVTGSGFWKATGIDRPIHSAADSSNCIGLKKSLVYYCGSAGKGTKTDWMMHEFRLPSNNEKNNEGMHEAEVWTICRIFKRTVTYKKYTPQQSKGLSTSYNQTQSDSSSKTSSFESDNGDEQYQCYANTYQHTVYPDYYQDDRNRLYSYQHWGQTVQAPMSTQYEPNFPSLDQYDQYDQYGSFDELGRIMSFVSDQPMLDPCRYS